MDFLVQIVSFIVVIGLVALAVRFGGRLFARTTIQWALCFKFSVIFVVLWLLITLVPEFLRATGFWLGVLIVLASHAAVGAIYLGPRVIKQSGQSLGPVTGAMVGVGAALLWLGVSLPLLFALGFRG
jgi:hypothetical protein